MASVKGPIRAHINAAVHAAFPPARVAKLVEDGSLHHELEYWLELCEEAIPQEWRRDWSACSFKYALAALAGEGVQWEPRRVRQVYTGPLALCEVGRAVKARLRRSGGYGGRNGRAYIYQWYLPEQVTTSQQGNGEVAFVDGELRHISWPVHGPQRADGPSFAEFDNWLGDSPF